MKRNSFSLDISNAAKGVTEDLEKIQSGTFLGLFSKIVIGTPVGNASLWESKYKPKGYIGGTLRGAWNASIGSQDDTKTGKIDKTGGPTIGAISSVISASELGDKLYLTNPQPYAIPVEYGYSSQRPAGMARVAIAEAQRVLDAEAAKRNK